jgi:Mn2+/Fe2+ NRAMP family transporter
MLIAQNKAVMGEDRVGPITTSLGWIAVAVMGAASVALLLTL